MEPEQAAIPEYVNPSSMTSTLHPSAVLTTSAKPKTLQSNSSNSTANDVVNSRQAKGNKFDFIIPSNLIFPSIETSGFSSTTCSQRFVEFELLVSHMFSMHVTDSPATQKPMKSSCGATPYQRRRPAAKFACELCNTSFNSDKVLKRHIGECHHIHVMSFS